MRSSKGYGSYRGKGGVRTVLKVLIAILLIVLILVAVGFFMLEKYQVFDSDGMHLELPFLHREEPSAPPEPEVTLPVVLPPATPSPTPAPEVQILHAAALPRSALYDGTAQALVTAKGANAAVFDMKADDGSLGYISNLELAKAVGASASDPALNAAIQGLNGGDLYTVARVSCFKDNLTPYKKPELGLKSPYGNWRDGGGLRWMSPAVDEARQYVADVCRELAALGFDEILLDNSGFPTGDKVGSIVQGAVYDPDKFSAVITGFYDQVRAALADYPDVTLSIMGTESAVADGADALTGQTLASLVQAGRVWLPEGGRSVSDYQAILSAAGMDSAGAAVLVRAEAGAADESWAVLTQE